MSVLAPARTRPAGGIARLRRSWWHYGVLGVVALLVGAPLFFLVAGSFSSARLPTEFSFTNVTLDNYLNVYLDPLTYRLLGNTVIYVLGSVAMGMVLAVSLAWLVERTNLPWKTLLYAGIPMTLAIPGLLQAIAWVLLLSPRIGIINRFLVDTFGFAQGPLNIYSMGGMIFLEGLRLVPTAFLMLVPLLRTMDPSLEEAASVSGARPASVVRKVTLRLLLPGIVAVSIFQVVTALEVFEIPGVIGIPAGIYVFSTQIYSLVRSINFVPVYGQANALAMVYVLIAVVSTFFYLRLIGHAERFTVVTGKGYRPRQFDLGRWRYPALALVLLYLGLAVVLPFLMLFYSSLLPFLQAPSPEAFQRFSLDNYGDLMALDLFWTVLKNTALMVLVAATLTVVLSFAISWIVVRTSFANKKLLDQLAFVTHSIPGIVMGLALLWVVLQMNDVIPLYGTIWPIAIGFAISFLAYGTRATNAGLLQVHKELEEAAYLSGARPPRMLLRVFFPLMLPVLVGVWIWVVLLSVRIAGLPLMLSQSADSQVLAILVWNMWERGNIGGVSAIGVMLMVSLLLITLLVRYLGFRRHTRLQQVDSYGA